MKDYDFKYDKSWEEIYEMLEKAMRKQQVHYMKMQSCEKGDRIYHMRNYKALEGVVKELKWVLGAKGIEHPLE